MIYANNAGTSWPKPQAVIEAVGRALRLAPGESAGTVNAARDAVGRFLNVPSPERLLFTPGCTPGLALALGDLPWERDEVLVTSALEHHAVGGVAARLVRERGVSHRIVARAPDGPIDLDALRDVLLRGRVRCVAMTAASNVTGELLPVREVATLAHEHGAWFLLDAAQTVGVVETDVLAIGADIVAFAGHKGPRGPLGVGVLWASPDVTFASPKASCEILVPGEPVEACIPYPGDCDIGGVNVPGVAGLAAGIEWHQARAEKPGAIARRLRRELVSALAERPGCRLYGEPHAPATGALSVAIDGLPVERAEAWFAERDIVVRAGSHCAPLALEAISAPEGTVRISFGPDNGDDDVGAIVDAIAAIAAG